MITFSSTKGETDSTIKELTIKFDRGEGNGNW